MAETAPKPRIRLDRKEVKAGETIEIKSLISHIMESGQRRDPQGNIIPRKIINKFTCELDGEMVFGADLEPAVSANPYFQFKIKPGKSGTLKFTWIDDDGSKIEATEQIKVT
ncbi:thiosulfate oxidation carrier complex protein SoxZ [Microvirga rosea]|uniref:thiosulfate oxidation carrier complex protein SoxZ n=1 Tax=Microvirga rosea TaxID=2715425 RepID=UPI001D0B6814|nr:thiosulfate oxidation carrier complex protein SoxZ [Microvirga rosea]MCB8823496.1 thiosulfate oxidation carrier complex protein SoxZ [Microvirga rosea]